MDEFQSEDHATRAAPKEAWVRPVLVCLQSRAAELTDGINDDGNFLLS